MTATFRRHTPRVPGSTGPYVCVNCWGLNAENHDGQYCTACLLDVIRERVEVAETVVPEATERASKILLDAAEQLEEALAEVVELADLTDQVPTELEERIAALRGVK